MSAVQKGACFCGAIQIELTGAPQGMGYCHCESCRAWSGDPVHAWTVWPAEALKIAAGEEHMATFQKTPDSLSHRRFCAQCGGHVMVNHPDLGIIDVMAGVLPDLEFAPTMHLNCAEAVVSVKDDLPRYKDFPSEFSELGGTGELMP